MRRLFSDTRGERFWRAVGIVKVESDSIKIRELGPACSLAPALQNRCIHSRSSHITMNMQNRCRSGSPYVSLPYCTIAGARRL